jgi:hypothetical protein
MNTIYQQFFFDLRGKLVTGQISYDEAKNIAKPILDEMNIKAKAIARKHGKTFSGFIFEKLIR